MPNPLPPQLTEVLNRELAENEQVIWASVPELRGFIKASWQNLQVGAVFFTFATFWMWNVGGEFMERSHAGKPTGNSVFMLVFGAVFMAISLRSLLAPVWESYKGRRTVYAITDRRAVIIQALRALTVRSFQGEQLALFERREDRLGRGDIVFAREARHGAKGRCYYHDIGFIGVEDVRGVDRLLKACHEQQRHITTSFT